MNFKERFKDKYVHVTVGFATALVLSYFVCNTIYQRFAWMAAPNMDLPYGSEIQWDMLWVVWGGALFFSIPVGFGIGIAVSVLMSRLLWVVKSKIIDRSNSPRESTSWFSQESSDSD